ncbi:MAG: RNA pseudouridine synthase [Treponema sp.]
MQTVPPPALTGASFDYTRTEPCIIRETPEWAAVYKPPRMPTAPLREGETGNLVHWFLCTQPGTTAAQVRGKKIIEAGLLHRLDTDTRGLVLFAKDQPAYDFLAAQQEAGRIRKTYHAFVSPHSREAVEQLAAALPYTVISQFRNFGPGAKQTAAVFPHSRRYKENGRLYKTAIYCLSTAGKLTAVQCRLSRGYRHQVRVHLSSLSLPITGDPLYCRAQGDSVPQPVGLQLYAISLSFPDPEHPQQNIDVVLPPPDKMNP